MAEVAGLAIGAFALIGAFKDCIDLFSYFSAARSLGRDYEIAHTKLEIEKVLLLQWADKVKLLSHDYDRRLDQPVVREAVAKVLASVKLLLDESQTICNRYGFKRVDYVVADNRRRQMDLLGDNRMQTFTLEFDQLNVRLNRRREHVSTIGKARWAVVDKQKFHEMIQELSYFIAKLHNIVPTDGYGIFDMAKEDFKSVRDLSHLRLIYDASLDQNDTFAQQADLRIQSICEERILNRLWFRTIDERLAGVKPPHSQTLKWALDPSKVGIEWDSLPIWLKSGSGIYWLSGKAGSGKSTLMKYLLNHPSTRTLLSEWAKPHVLILDSFFFWHAGTPEQRSLEGLWRALLFKVLDSDRSLIPRLLPTMWREARASDSRSVELDLPSKAEQQSAFDRLLMIQNHTRRFCFLIDGLDEYTGDYFEGINFLKRLTTNVNFKVVLSSRPIPECVDAFAGSPKLHLQKLTKDDISCYVNTTIHSQPYSKTLMGQDRERGERLVQGLIGKASGVFLWVVLACRSILEGFAAFDSIADLEGRVNELPPELEELFQHMLGRVPRRYQEQASKLLRLVFRHHLVIRRMAAPTLGLALVEECDFHIGGTSQTEEWSRGELRNKCEILEGRLRSRCCGLLEVKDKWTSNLHCFCRPAHGHHDILVDSQVQFVHRTVFEFLESPAVWQIPCLQLSRNITFDPSVVLTQMSTHLLGTSYLSGHKPFRKLITHALRTAETIESSNTQSLITIFQQLETLLLEDPHGYLPAVVKTLLRQYKEWYASITDCPVILTLSIQAGYTDLLRIIDKYSKLDYSVITGCAPLVYHAIFRPCWRETYNYDIAHVSRQTLQRIISAGCDISAVIFHRDPSGRDTWDVWTDLLEQGEQPWKGQLEVLDTVTYMLNIGIHIEDVAVQRLQRWVRQRFIDDEGADIWVSSSAKALSELLAQYGTQRKFIVDATPPYDEHHFRETCCAQ